ncbi:hypothetical protein ACIHEJ_02020 [Streptomyces sp. NPDC052301]|uniref:hypothetical protein n=1 Tax=Streptomyces sp. NPDC052301 TaxID=3365687 RepID=UPI0037D563D2
MNSIYALIRIDGGIQFRDGIPDQGTDSGAAFTIQRAAWGGHGLHGDAGDARGPAGPCPLNSIATFVVYALGGPNRCVFGDLTIGGDRFEAGSGKTMPCGLTEAQQHLIRDVHGTICGNADAAEGGDAGPSAASGERDDRPS